MGIAFPCFRMPGGAKMLLPACGRSLLVFGESLCCSPRVVNFLPFPLRLLSPTLKPLLPYRHNTDSAQYSISCRPSLFFGSNLIGAFFLPGLSQAIFSYLFFVLFPPFKSSQSTDFRSQCIPVASQFIPPPCSGCTNASFYLNTIPINPPTTAR